MPYAPILLTSLLSGLSMPLIIGLAQRRDLYDKLDERKIHTGKIARLGGVGVFGAFVAVVLLLPFIVDSGLLRSLQSRLQKLLPLILGAAIMHLTGLVDDLSGGKVHAIPKLIFQITAALLVVLGGYRFKAFGFHSDILASQLSWFSVILTIGWIIGISNALNLIDGMDGLAGGISFIVTLAYGAFYQLTGDTENAFICLSLAGAVAGFLFANFPAPKAKIFMGDSGSLFLGFMLATIPFLGQTAGQEELFQIGLLPAMLVLAIPMTDTLCAIGRRLKAHVGITTPDRGHIHHKLLDHGFSPIRILFMVYLVTVFECFDFLVARYLPDLNGFLAELIGFCVVGIFFRYGFSLMPMTKTAQQTKTNPMVRVSRESTESAESAELAESAQGDSPGDSL